MLRLPVLGLVLSFLMVVAGPTAAKDDPAPDAWQAVITTQLEALRHGDAPTALSFADARLQHSFADPAQFVEAIKAWGYEPLVGSRSHSFGPYRRLSPYMVVQDVKFVGGDLGLYEAHFLVGIEEGLWRVHRVMRLIRTPGMGV